MACTRILISAVVLALGSASFASANAEEVGSSQGFAFIVIGDTPYGPKDETMLAAALERVKDGAYRFVIHVGDYKGGRAPCTVDHDEGMKSLIAELAPMPVFYTPGDNEWTDCDRNINEVTGKRFSDLDRLDRVRDLFFSEPLNAPAEFSYERQAAMAENASWRYQNVRFATLHVTGTNNGRDWVTGDPLERALDAVTVRDAANMAWIGETFRQAKEEEAGAVVIAMHGDPTDIRDKPADKACETVAKNNDHACDAFTHLRARLRDEATSFARPVLVIHGDTAPFTLNQEFSGEEADTLWRLNAAGDAGVGRTGIPYGLRDIVEVAVETGADIPFSATGVLTEKKPKSK